MICRNCGAENPDGAQYCGNCSASLVNAVPNNAQGYAQPGYNQQYYSQQPVQNGYNTQPYGVPPYGAQPYGGQPYVAQPVQQQIIYANPPQPAGVPGAGQCTTSLVFSIIALVLCWVPFLGMLLAFIGLLNGIIGVARSAGVRRVRPQGIVGLVLSAIAEITSIILTMAIFEAF